MEKKLKIFLFLLLTLCCYTGSSFSLDLGTNITIWDREGSGSAGNPMEDEEVTLNCVPGQEWDLEGFFLSGTTLTMVGGYDFINGGYGSGDIFLDIDGDAVYGPANNGSGSGKSVVSNLFGYDYVLDLDFDNFSYDIIDLTSGSPSTVTVYYGQNVASNPWQYSSGGDLLLNDVAMGYYTGLSDGDVDGLLGGYHNAVVVDLSFLGDNINFTSHFTMGCGNDNLMGSGTTSVPEPTPMILLGSSLIGLAGFGGRKFLKK